MIDTTAAIEADRLRLSCRNQPVFPPLSFRLEPGTLTAVLGASGTGKTALLLTLAGRMRGWHGRASVCGLDLARESAPARRTAGLGLLSGVNDLAEALSASAHVVEARLFVPRRERAPHADVLARVGLSAVAGLRAKQLDAEQRVRLGIALALVRDIRILVVDDVDRDLNQAQRIRLLALLRELAEDGLTVVYACVDDETTRAADAVIEIETGDVRLAHAEVVADAVA